MLSWSEVMLLLSTLRKMFYLMRMVRTYNKIGGRSHKNYSEESMWNVVGYHRNRSIKLTEQHYSTKCVTYQGKPVQTPQFYFKKKSY